LESVTGDEAPGYYHVFLWTRKAVAVIDGRYNYDGCPKPATELRGQVRSQAPAEGRYGARQ